MRRRRRRNRAAELTPLIDVLFIMLFAALLQARTAVERGVMSADAIADADASMLDASMLDASMLDASMLDASMLDASMLDASMLDAGMLDAGADAGPSEHLAQSRQIAARLASAVDNHDVFVVEVTGEGYVTSMARWSRGQEVRRDRVRDRLVRPVLPGESAQKLAYIGEDEPALRLCPLVREHFQRAADDEDPFMVLVVLDAPLVDLPLALYRGLSADLRVCFADAAGVGILLQPGEDDHGIP
jgi:hypothetical protein